MAILDSLKGMFTRKRTLDDVSMDELRREKIRLEQEEARLTRQVEELERQKQQLFLKGKDEASERQQRILARKIKEVDVQARNIDKNLRFISHQLRVVNGFIQVKENQRLWQEAGISSIITQLDLEELQKYVEAASVEGALHLDKFRELLEGLEESERLVGLGEEDKDIEEIMRAMQEARQADLEAPGAVEELARQRLDEILHNEEREMGV